MVENAGTCQHPYENLSPETIMDGLDAIGFHCSGHLLALNSYENRVYQLGQDEGPPVIAKFYRPGRWSNEAIREEHVFTTALADAEVPVVAPIAIEGKTLFEYKGFRIAVYPRRGGRAPDLGMEEHLEWLGRFIGRIHLLGGMYTFEHRPDLNPQTFGYDAREIVLQSGFVPDYLRQNYESVSADLLREIDARYESVGPVRKIRLHGDCHPGNMLWTDDGPHFVDFDDARNGPAVQDLWMLLSGERDDMTRQLEVVLKGYHDFADFDFAELHLIESLRSLRMLHYAAWISSRWGDPAFPMAFPWFDSPRYWEEHIQTLREQLYALDLPVLQI